MRLLLAEGSAILRAGLAHVLADQGHQLVASVHDAGALAALIAAHRPDALIANVRLEPGRPDEGLEAALDARRRQPGLRALVFAAEPEPQHVARLFAGDVTGLGYLIQDRMTDAGELLDSLTRISLGATVVDPRMIGALAAGTAFRPHARHIDGFETLSERELQVLSLMAQGRTNASIAERLVISPGTVEKRVAAVFDKLDIPGSPSDNRRVLAVLRYLADRHAPAATPGGTRPATRLQVLSTAA